MVATITTVGLDADDTLWHNERLFQMTQERLAELLADHAEPGHLMERLLAAETRNLGQYGFGVKGFTLSMIETALDVTDDSAPGEVIRAIIEAGQEMLSHPVELLAGAPEAVAELAGRVRLVLVTKGDLLDQERKLAQSGLGDMFDAVEIVSDKSARTYREVFARHGEGAERALMAGNSLRSDVLPAIAAGAFGVFVPHEHAWTLEQADEPDGAPRYRRIETLAELPQMIEGIG